MRFASSLYEISALIPLSVFVKGYDFSPFSEAITSSAFSALLLPETVSEGLKLSPKSTLSVQLSSADKSEGFVKANVSEGF